MERQLLNNLKAVHSRDLLGALGRLPRNMRMLYTHSYQASERERERESECEVMRSMGVKRVCERK